MGDRHPGYMLMVARNNWAEYATAKAAIAATIRQGFPEEEAEGLLDLWSLSVDQVESEVWLYRRDLSYFPNR